MKKHLRKVALFCNLQFSSRGDDFPVLLCKYFSATLQFRHTASGSEEFTQSIALSVILCGELESKQVISELLRSLRAVE